ncbi:hypothetical protein GGR57DRAFT_516944 [Xylariaceae sp. FL1272]|nr:hypothetical protein GGR57DRAFT_516944 [Xylariaceae sp. FL1272]
MEIQPDCIVVSESFEKYYADNDRCRFSRGKVQKFLDRGHMRLDAVLQRYTDHLSHNLSSACGNPSVVNGLRILFQSLRDPVTGCLSSAGFKRLVAEKLSHLEPTPSEETLEILLDIFVSHAFHPFPPPYESSVLAQIDENSFLRALSLLAVPKNRGIGPKSRNATHGVVGGEWGSHSGSYHRFRGRDASDYRRDTGNHHYNSRPRFSWSEPRSGGSEQDYDQQQFVVFEDEPEVSVDILDVLAEITTESYRIMPSPFRESYSLVLPSLPKRQEDISSLCLPKNRLVTLIKLCGEVRNIDSTSLMASVQHETSGAHVDWKGFEKVMSEDTELLADGLSDIFLALTRPQGERSVEADMS